MKFCTESAEEAAARQAIESVLSDPAGSNWLKAALREAVLRDPVDAANDSEILHDLLVQRCDAVFKKWNTA